MRCRWILLSLCLCVSVVPLANAQETDIGAGSDTFFRARVLEILSEEEEEVAGFERTVQEARLRIESGEDEGMELTIENGILNNRADMRLQEGEKIVLEKIVTVNGETEYLFREKYRIPSLLWLLALFFALSVLFGGFTGVRAFAGLAFSIGVLVFFVIPRIIEGGSPLAASVIGSLLIACISLFLAHGFNKRTTVALFSTVTTLLCSVVLARIFVAASHLFGMGTEETVFLQAGPLQSLDLRGLLLGGIIIGTLGVLDDITTAQTAAIDEIHKANPRLTFRQLFASGISIGREHIASLINTLALAYVGASLPLLLLLSQANDTPVWVVLNSEFLAEEIVRTLVGSSTLLFAVPISTWFAAYAYHKHLVPHEESSSTHHSH